MTKNNGQFEASKNYHGANDNEPNRANDIGQPVERNRGGKKFFPRIFTDLPERPQVTNAELDLIEAYYPGLISGIIANDN